MSKQSFIKGAMILMAAGIFSRILGFVPRMVLPRIIGAEGIGLYQMGYPLMSVLITMITGGIPLAIAKLVAEAESEGSRWKVRKLLIAAVTISGTLGLISTILLACFAGWIAEHIFTDSRVHLTFLSMSPIIFLVSISAVFRGYFQGKHNMVPTATSQVAETIARSIAVLAIAYALLPHGIEYAAAGAMGGVLLGEVIGLAVLMLHFRRSDTRSPGMPFAPSGRGFGLRRLMRISIPVTAGKLVGSASYFLESIMIVQSLAVAGVAVKLATAQYGALQGMAIPLLLLPTALTYSLSVSLIPSLSEAAARNDRRTIHKRLHQSLRLALLIGAPFAVIVYVLAEPICLFLYKDAQVSVMLKWMAPVTLFIYLQAPLQATLQALDKPGRALLNTFIGASVKLTLIYILAAKSGLGIFGAVLAININIVLVTVLHWNSVVRMLGIRANVSDMFKVLAGALPMGLVTHYLFHAVEHQAAAFVAAAAAGLFIYLSIMVISGIVDRDDMNKLLWIGKKIRK